jgi:pimeloyl-ACP methyl ester carboxylesterase
VTEVRLDLGGAALTGDLEAPDAARGLVVFAHGSGSGRLSPRNRDVAARLQGAGFATLLFDLLTPEEADDRELVFAIDLLAGRLEEATRWGAAETGLPVGLFGASTGAAAALEAAAAMPDVVRAVVSRGGRPDLAAGHLPAVRAPTLLLVGSRDASVLALNEGAADRLRCTHRLDVVEGAGHLFEEPGALEEVARAAAAWLREHV